MTEYSVLRLDLRAKAEAVLREMFLDFAAQGLSTREMSWWSSAACWFPHLRDRASVKALSNALPVSLRSGQACEPQLLWSLPEVYDGELWTHVDEPPPWAIGRKYLRIVGVALTPWNETNGSPRLYTSDGIVTPELDVGDVLVMAPDLPHTRGINRSGNLRAAAYFRFLDEGEDRD